jgi:hypothetical protein
LDKIVWTELIVAGIGSLVGSGVGAYFSGYVKTKWEHVATYENIKTLLAEEREKAYAQERGKRLATTDDIDKILKEVEAVTHKAETIKSQISGDLWNRQAAWNEKRDIYGKLIESLHQINKTATDVSVYSKNSQDNKYFQTYLDAERVFAYQTSLARIFLNSQSRAALDEFVSNRMIIKGGWDHASLDAYTRKIVDLMHTLVAAAQKDLGLA